MKLKANNHIIRVFPPKKRIGNYLHPRSCILVHVRTIRFPLSWVGRIFVSHVEGDFCYSLAPQMLGPSINLMVRPNNLSVVCIQLSLCYNVCYVAI